MTDETSTFRCCSHDMNLMISCLPMFMTVLVSFHFKLLIILSICFRLIVDDWMDFY